jgi:hypothetical protein
VMFLQRVDRRYDYSPIEQRRNPCACSAMSTSAFATESCGYSGCPSR